jgi:hypothetical protein
VEFKRVFYELWQGEAWAEQLGGIVKSVENVLDRNGNKCYRFIVECNTIDSSDLWG